MTTVVVLGDVHGNARALRAALDHARQGPMDQLVFIGDLLTYGHDVDEVLDLVAEAQDREHAILLVGNHDQMYFDLAEHRCAYFEALPGWIRESALRTLERLDVASFTSRFRWSQQHVLEQVLFAHANPFGFGDWTYLNSREDHARATKELQTRGYSTGVFGHTHRPRWGGEEAVFGHHVSWSGHEPLVVNVGAVGQPRDGTGCAVLVRLELAASSTSAMFERVDYDVEAHIESLHRVGLSEVALERLTSFFH